ncbi:MAG: hypothetical protein ACRC18_09150 [Cetobacterium sp.]
MEKLLEELYLKKKKKDIFDIDPDDEVIINEDEIECIESIKNKINTNDITFRKNLLKLKKEDLKKEIKDINSKRKKLENNLKQTGVKKSREVMFRFDMYDRAENKIIQELKNLKEEKLYEFLKEESEVVSDIEKRKIYFYKKILQLFYSDYLRNIAEPKWIINEKNNILKKEYKYIGEDEQYIKYGLIKLNENRVIEKHTLSPNSYPQYICDKRLKKYIIIEDISREMLVFLSELLEKKNIGELSLRVSVYTKLEENHTQVALEDREFGKYFSFRNLKEILPTKLYNMENNELWINIDKKNITFEEILEDFVSYEDYIVTQVVHCEYFEENQEFFINHLDHEYIFYTMEEYEERQNNINQKGNGSKRVKTFKIDNSKIPFILESGDNFLLKILNEYFKSKDLLEEYFQNIKN